MAKRRTDDPSQLLLFDDPIFWWPGRPPRPVQEAEPPRRPRPATPAPLADPQLRLFRLPDPTPRRRRSSRLKTSARPQTYLELALSVGLPRMVQLFQLPATWYWMDACPLRAALGVDTLLEARYRLQDHLFDAFEDLVEAAPTDVKQSPFSMWGGRQVGVEGATSPRGEVLSLAIAAGNPRVTDPFLLRLRGLPGFLKTEDGPPPLEEGQELLSLYDRGCVYELLPLEAQPMTLESLLAG